MSTKDEALSNTPYDDAFRTLVTKGGNLIIPFINELFKSDKPIQPDAVIVHEANEQFLNIGNGEQEKTIVDSIVIINGEAYHIECQSTDDGTILVRIAKYDWMIAMRHSHIEGNRIRIPLPHSGLLYLRKTTQTPDSLYVNYYGPSGHELEYPVKVVALADYTLDDLIEKNLVFLLPFYLFNLEKDLKDFDKQESSREKVVSSYNGLLSYLNDLRDRGELSIYHYSLVIEMLKKVTDNLAHSHERARKELDEIMGGKVLRFTNEDIFDEATDNKEFQDIQRLMKNKGWTAAEAMDALDVAYDKRAGYEKRLQKTKQAVTV